MIGKPLEPISFPTFSQGQQRALLSFYHPNNKLLTKKIWQKQNHFGRPFTFLSLPGLFFPIPSGASKSTPSSLKTSPSSFSSSPPSPPPHPTSPPPPPRRRPPSFDGKSSAFALTSRRAPPAVPPAARRAAARALPHRSEQRRQRQLDTQTPDRSRSPRRPAPSRRAVVHHGRVERAARGASVGALLRDVRQRQPGLLRHRGPRQPQRRRAPRRGGPRAGGALRVAPRQGHRRRRPPARGHPLRHRVRAQEPLQVALRGPAGLQAVGLRRDGRRRGGQVDDRKRSSWDGDQEERGRGRRSPAGPAVKS